MRLSVVLFNVACALHLKRESDFVYGRDKIRGINLGGWLLTEPFITPSLYQSTDADVSNLPVDEYHLSKELGKERAREVLGKHWETWVTESDFVKIKAIGFNTVRIPFGYWALYPRHEDPYVQGQEEYIDKAIHWARKHGLKVWLDLHGIPGSQNGFDNSGLRDTYEAFSPEYPHNLEQTYEILEIINNKYAGPEYSDVITGIQLLNEPLPLYGLDGVKDFFKKGYAQVREHGDAVVVIFDAFLGPNSFNDFMQPPEYENVVLDHHNYHCFEVERLKWSPDEHVERVCEYGRGLATETLWNVVAEWSGALTDCQPLLNGVYRGARYDARYQNDEYLGTCEGNEDYSTWSDERRTTTRRFIEAQLDAYDQGSGWFFWTWRVESSSEWDVQRLIEAELFPVPLDERKFPNQCGF